MSEFKVVASISPSGSLLLLYKKKRIFFIFSKYELVGGFRSEDEIQNYIKNNYQRSVEFYLDDRGNRTRCWG